MADVPDPTKRKAERFTMLEPRGPNNPTDEQKAWPVLGLEVRERFTMLEPRGPNNPTDEQKAWPVTEAEVNGHPPPEASPLRTTVAAMPKADREVFRHYYLDGADVKTVAERLGLTQNQVWAAIRRVEDRVRPAG